MLVDLHRKLLIKLLHHNYSVPTELFLGLGLSLAKRGIFWQMRRNLLTAEEHCFQLPSNFRLIFPPFILCCYLLCTCSNSLQLYFSENNTYFTWSNKIFMDFTPIEWGQLMFPAASLRFPLMLQQLLQGCSNTCIPRQDPSSPNPPNSSLHI